MQVFSPHLMDEETETEEVTDLPKVTVFRVSSQAYMFHLP